MISVVTPTFYRPKEVADLLTNLAAQTLLPGEVILVDGAAPDERATEQIVAEVSLLLPFTCRYIRSGRGTALQRNVGIEAAGGELIALIDDDVRLDSDFLAQIAGVFAQDERREVGGVVGYRINRHASAAAAARWRWYRRLKLLSVFEPGRYDFQSGYPINNNLQPPFRGTREVDFMTTACAVWRREVFDTGLRFDLFFRDYGVLEDAHFSLRARHRWKLLQCGDALCHELHSPAGREDRHKIGYKCVVNYYYVFRDIAHPLTLSQQYRFWRFQTFELIRIIASALRHRRRADVQELLGRLSGMVGVLKGDAFAER